MLNLFNVFPYGCDGDYTSRCHSCPQLGFSLNCDAKVQRNSEFTKNIWLKNVNELLKKINVKLNGIK